MKRIAVVVAMFLFTNTCLAQSFTSREDDNSAWKRQMESRNEFLKQAAKTMLSKSSAEVKEVPFSTTGLLLAAPIVAVTSDFAAAGAAGALSRSGRILIETESGQVTGTVSVLTVGAGGASYSGSTSYGGGAFSHTVSIQLPLTMAGDAADRWHEIEVEEQKEAARKVLRDFLGEEGVRHYLKCWYGDVPFSPKTLVGSGNIIKSWQNAFGAQNRVDYRYVARSSDIKVLSDEIDTALAEEQIDGTSGRDLLGTFDGASISTFKVTVMPESKRSEGEENNVILIIEATFGGAAGGYND